MKSNFLSSRNLLLIAYLLAAVTLAHAIQSQPVAGVYRGTLGKQEIVLEIGLAPPEEKDSEVIGRYFYRRHGVSIFLKGARAQDGSFLLTEGDDQKATSAHWSLKFQAEEANGNFCKCDLSKSAAIKAGQLPILLKRISSGFNPRFAEIVGDSSGAPAPDQAYYDQLLDFPLTTGSQVTTKAGYAYAMLTDPRFNVSMPRITRFDHPAAMEEVNKLLEQEFRKYRLLAAECLSNRSFGENEFSLDTRVDLFNGHLLTVVREGDSFCGGAHPNYDLYVNIYDLDSHAETSVVDLLVNEIDPEAIKNLPGRKENAATNLSAKDVVSRFLVELYIQRYKAEDEDCREVIHGNDADESPNLITTQYFSDRGLVVNADLPHVAQVCANPVVIPYGELRHFLKNDSRLLSRLEMNSLH